MRYPIGLMAAFVWAGLAGASASAQDSVSEPAYHDQSYRYETGLGLGVTGSETGDGSDNLTPRVLLRPFFRYKLLSRIQGDLSIGLGQMAGNIFSTRLIPIEHRFLLNMFTEKTRISPYAYAGIGLLSYNVSSSPLQFNGPKRSGFSGFIPAGLGIRIRITERLRYNLSAGVNRAFSDNLDGVIAIGDDAFYTIMGAFSFRNSPPDVDWDADGLTNREEKRYKTDRKNPDTDGDTLTDGAEIREHASNPRSVDTDSDGLPDGDEVNRYLTLLTDVDTDKDRLKDGDEVLRYRTDPLRADTDEDGLTDFEEISEYKINPLMPDTDEDGLTDGIEVKNHRTDPARTDTDGDGLTDGVEVKLYRIDPTKTDTDGGGVDDGQEVARGTDPRDSVDDIAREGMTPAEPPKPIKTPVATERVDTPRPAEVPVAVTLQTVLFDISSFGLSEEAKAVLDRNLDLLKQYPLLTLKIEGHTDNRASRGYNAQLSKNRAQTVRNYLVNRGIDPKRIKTTTGKGADHPTASNESDEGRRQNRRVELLTTP
ncbi:MAG: OmpA family protein [candidate division Zixibacteria bacterium]|nr:OmpA family protein [candidate division Zixibacteria bacterium]